MIGITGYPLGPLKEVLERSKVKVSTVLSYSRETLFDKSLMDFLPFLNDKGVRSPSSPPFSSTGAEDRANRRRGLTED